MAAKLADRASGRLSKKQIAENFADLHPVLEAHEALVEADRCYFCYDAPCMQACPTSIDIPLFIRQIATGLPEAAAKTIFDQNILGGMCARVCPTETLCEEVCVRETAEGKPVKIGQLQRYATDKVIDAKAETHPYVRGPASGRRIAVVGSGPAGLACAHRLALLGHDVTIFEARKKAGGLNEHGIASYKTVDDFAAREVAFIISIGGIEIKKAKTLSKNLKLTDLQKTYDAVFLGLGLAGINRLDIQNEDAEGVQDAVAYIEALRQAKDKSKLEVGRRVLVIGGGMTAIDIAIQSKLLGAEEVTILYRRGPDQMKASPYERELAQTRGVTIRHWVVPKKIITKQGKVSALRCAHVGIEGNEHSSTGRRSDFEADVIFKAIGQKLLETQQGALKLRLGRIEVDEEQRTSVTGIWAGGDCVAGGEDLTVAAARDGRRAALSIHATLMTQEACHG